MIDPKVFLTDFVKDIVKNPMERQELIAGYAVHLQAMIDDAINKNAETKKTL